MSYGMHVQALSIFAKTDLAATYDDLGVIGLAKFLAYVILPLVIGVILNRTNNAYVITIGIALHAIPLFMMSRAESIWEVILYQFCVGSSHAFIWPPTNAILSTNSKTRVTQIAQAVMFHLIGLAIGPLLGVLILDVTDENYHILFQASAVVMACSTVAAIMLRSRLPKTRYAPVDIKAFGKILHFPVVIALVFFTTAVSGTLFVIYPAYLTEHDINASSILFLYFIYGVVRAASMLIVNYLHRRMIIVLALCVASTTGGLAISAFGTSFVHFAIALSMMGLGIMAYPICLEMLLSRTKQSIANKMIGAFSTLIGIGWLMGPVIAGYIAHRYGPEMPYLVFLIVGGVATLMVATMRKGLVKVENRHRTAKVAVQTIKNQMNVILLSIGLLDKALAKADSYKDVPSGVIKQYEGLGHTVTIVGKNLKDISNMVDPDVVREVRDLLYGIEDTDVAVGVGVGYPGYDNIRGSIAVCMEHLNDAINVDIIMDVRHWLRDHYPGKR